MDTLDILLAQHKDIRSKIGEMLNLASLEVPDFGTILKCLSLFNAILHGHLELEDKIFYPEILAKMEKKNLDSTNTKIFILKMKEIEKKVAEFIIKYSSIEKIKTDFEDGVKDNIYYNHLNEIVSIVLLRIDTEEDSVYMYWKL